MKLVEILNAHKAHCPPGALPKNLGDGFLLRYNPVYRAIRNQAKKNGFQFTAKRFEDYDSLALTQLPQILVQKKIPYCDNVSPLQKIEAAIPNHFSFSSIPSLRSNHVFHESAHAVAHEILKKQFQKKYSSRLERERSQAFQIFLEESFANACESLSNLYATDEVHDEFLYKNSYIMENERTRKALRSAVTTLGISVLIRILLLSFLHANFLQTKVTEETISRVTRLARVPKPYSRSLVQTLFRSGLSLDPEFTRFTNQFCLRLLGIETDLLQLMKVDLLTWLEKDAESKQAIDRLSIFLSELLN